MTQSRRKFSRQPIQISALVHPAQGRSWLCVIKDFCEEGMLLSGAGGGRSLAATGAEAGVDDNVAVHFSVATPTGQMPYAILKSKISHSGKAGLWAGLS